MCFMLQLIYASVIPAKMEQLATVMVKHTNAHVHLDLLDFTVKQVKCKAVISSQYGVALWNIAFIVEDAAYLWFTRQTISAVVLLAM